MEVWITNKRANYDQSRNIIAFMDLGEAKRIDNTALWKNTASKDLPQNKANNLYDNVKMIPDVRYIQQTNAKLSEVYGNDIVGGEDYEKIESARKLDPSEYTLNKELGTISLKSQLNPDEVLGVAYEYTRELS